MDIKQLKNIIPTFLKTDIAPNLIGMTGIGKTSVLYQHAKEKGDHLTVLNIATQEVGDLLGLPDHILEDGQKIATKFIVPDWALTAQKFALANPDKYAIIFLDEINRQPRRDVLQAIFPLVLEKRLHTYNFAPNVRIVAAMNPDSDDDFTTDLGKALINRFCHIKVTTSVSSFCDYAEGAGIGFEITDFIKENPTMLVEDSNFSIPEKKPYPRMWEFVDRLKKEGMAPGVFQELLYGLIGQTTTIAFLKYLENAEKPLRAADILDRWTKENKKRISSMVDDEGGRRLDMLKITLEDLGKEIFSEGFSLTTKQEKNLTEFLLMIPRGMLFGFCQEGSKSEFFNKVFGNNMEIIDAIRSVNK
jgi:hypothetical protein